ncbi:MAG: hypothetical protein AABY78_01850 [Nitrospirota bacterium]
MNTAIKIAVACFLLSGVAAQAFQLGSPFDNPMGQTYRKELEQLIVPADHLPPSCRLVTEIKTAPIFPAMTNPFVTDNAQLIDFVSLIGFGNKQLQDVSVAMSALYVEREPQHEVGIWGLRFMSPKAATAGYESLKQREVLRKGALLIALWRDNEIGKACQQAIKAHLVKNGFEILAAKP